MRIKFVGPVYKNDVTYFAYHPESARIAEVFPDEGRIKLVDGAHIHRRQVVSVLRPKPRKQEKRDRVERWMCFDDALPVHERFYNCKQEFGENRRNTKQLRLMELDSDEIPVSRKKLEAAWDESAGMTYMKASGNERFEGLCTALGFPQEKEGER